MHISERYLDTRAVLNTYASRLIGQEAAFHIYTWGANPVHRKNAAKNTPFFRIHYVLQGCGTYEDEDITLPLAPGTIFCARPGKDHLIYSEHSMSTLWVQFEIIHSDTSERFNRHFRHIAHSSQCFRTGVDDSLTAILWRQLWKEAEKPQSSITLALLSSLAYALLLSFAELLGENEQRTFLKIPIRKSSEMLRQVQQYIDENLSQSLLLQDVAECFYISGRQLSRLFKKKTGSTFSEYVRAQRLKRAVDLLTTSTLSIEEVAHVCGFGNVYYFTRVFTKTIGITPGKYMKIQ